MNKLKKEFFFLKKSRFIKDVSLLFSGAILAQAITISLTPVFSRLYTPEEFGLWATLSSIIGILSVIGSLRYELAIILPDKVQKAFNLVLISFIISVILFFIILFLVLILDTKIVDWFFKGDLNILYLYYIPIGVFITVFARIAQNWFVFLKKFKFISFISVATALSNSIIKIIGGIFGLGLIGLLLSHFVGFLIVAFLYLLNFFKTNFSLLKKIKLEVLKKNAIEYKDFPLYSAPQGAMNAFAQFLPMLMFTTFYNAATTGYYLFAFRLVTLPVSLVSKSFKSVIYKKISETFNQSGDVFKIIWKATLGLFILGIIPAIFLFLFGEELFSLVLGSQWSTAGQYAEILIIWVFIGFLTTPSNVTFQVYGKQRFFFYYELVLTIFRLSAFLIGGIYYDVIVTIWFYTIIGAIFNAFMILYMLYFSKKYYFLKKE